MREIQKQVLNSTLKNEVIVTRNTLTSLEVAEMMEVEHKNLIKKLEGDKTHVGIIPVLSTQLQLELSDYYIVSSYIDGSGKENKCYDITKKGCEMLAHKMTGEKGIIFTAKYIERFHTMENYIRANQENQYEMLVASQQELYKRFTDLSLDLNTQITELKQQAEFNHRPSHATKLSWSKVIKTYSKCRADEENIKALVFAKFNIGKWEDLTGDKFSEVFAYIREIAEKANLIQQQSLF